MIKKRGHIANIKWDIYSKGAGFMLGLIVVTGICSKFIANDRPIVIGDKDGIYFPVFSKSFEKKWAAHNNEAFIWSDHKYPRSGWPIIPYAPGESDLLNANYRPPFSKVNRPPQDCTVGSGSTLRYRHWLGTNLKGEDVLSGIIHGTSVSLKIGFFSIFIALCIGTLLGILAGYFQNDSWKVPLLSFILMLVSLVPTIYIAGIFSMMLEIYAGINDTKLLIGSLLTYFLTINLGLLLSYYIGKLIHSIFKWQKKISVPVDMMISRLIEIFAAIPKLMLVVALAAILERSVTNVIIVIGVSAWAGIARLVRAETMKVRNQDFISSAKSLGLSHFRIIMRHIMPNISGPLIVSFVFGVSAAILIESGLSFLNMGVPENVITWGQLLADGKRNFNAWWLIVFPGFAIFITVFCLNILGEKFKSMVDPRNRSFT